MSGVQGLRSNLFGGKCIDCRRDVPAGKGVAVRLERRRRVSWGVRCAECVAAQKKGGAHAGRN